MEKIKLLFADVGNLVKFLTLVKPQKVEFYNNTLEGYFSQGEVEIACRDFKATLCPQSPNRSFCS